MFNRNNSGGGGCVCACVHAHVFIKVSKQHIYVDLFFLKSISSLWTVRSSKSTSEQRKTPAARLPRQPESRQEPNQNQNQNRLQLRVQNNIYRSTNQQYEFGFMSPNIFSLKTLKTNTSTCDGVTKERSHECSRWGELSWWAEWESVNTSVHSSVPGSLLLCAVVLS